MARSNRKKGELALLLGISPAAVTRRISGETALDVNELCMIAQWLNIPVTTLLPAGLVTPEQQVSPPTDRCLGDNAAYLLAA